MIDFKSLEFFFSKQKDHTANFALNSHAQNAAPVQIKEESFPTIKPAEILSTPQPVQQKPKEVQTIIKTTPKKVVKKDKFYTEWEQKYKALQAESLLAKKPFHKHALFIIEKTSPTAFAKKICEAINSKLMKATLVTDLDSLEDLILTLEPTHIIYESSLNIETELPIITFDNLSGIKADPDKKKALWNTLKQQLKEI